MNMANEIDGVGHCCLLEDSIDGGGI